MGRYLQIASIAAVLFASITLAQAQKANIAVKQQSDVKAADITLREIAAIKSGDKALIEKLNNAVVCRSPLPGRSFKISRAQVISAIRRASVAEGSVTLNCSDQVSVTRTSSTVTGQMLFDAAQDYILNNCSWSGNITVEKTQTPTDQLVPEGNVELRVNPATRQLRKGRNSIDVEMVVDDTVYARTQVPVFIRILSPVLVATKAIARSEAITPENTIIREQDVTAISDDIFTEIPEGDVIANLALPEGAVVKKKSVTTPFAICSGDPIIVVVKSGSVVLSEKGVAQANGRKGDRINIKMNGADRIVKAVILEPGVAEITLGRRS